MPFFLQAPQAGPRDTHNAASRYSGNNPNPRYSGKECPSPRSNASVLDRNTSFAKGMQQKKQVPANSAFGAIVGQATAVNKATDGMRTAKMMQTSGATKGDGTVHSFAEEEVLAFSDFMNSKLGADAQLQYLLPISSPDELFGSVADGVLLSKMINVAAPDTIDERVLNLGARNPFQVGENQNLMINAAKSIGLKVINIGSEDMIEGRPHLVLGLLWQMVKMALMARINLRNCPFLARLLQDGETLEDLLKLTPEQILLRWINFHLKEAGSNRRVHNFGTDLCDSEAYVILLKQIDPEGKCNTNILRSGADKLKRATYVVEQGARLTTEFRIRPADIVKANEKLNLGFVAALFNACPGLEPVDIELPDDDEDDREERAFRMWINSLGIERHIADLFEDMKDGIALAQLMELLQPGVVDWKRIKDPTRNIFDQIANCAHGVQRATAAKPQGFGFSLVGVDGKDLNSGNRKLTLALIWQLRRHSLLMMLSALRERSAGPLTDDAILRWANETVAASGSSRKLTSFGDASLGDSLFFADLLNAVRPGSIKREVLANTPAGRTGSQWEEDKRHDEKKANAKYVLTVARKLGCAVFLTWEDMLECRPKMMFSFCATIMGLALSEDGESDAGRRASIA